MLTLLAKSVVCPWNQMPELTIYRQSDLESAHSSAPAEQQAADVTPEPATTTDIIQLLPSFSQWLSSFWKKGPPSNDMTTVPGHSHQSSQGSQDAAGSTTSSTPDPAVDPPAGAESQETPVSAQPSADATMPDSTQSY
jgi:hypothetical protein